MGVDIGFLQDAELIVPILNRPDVGVGFVELAKLVLALFAAEALFMETGLVGVENGEETAQIGDVFRQGAGPVASKGETQALSPAATMTSVRRERRFIG